MKKYKRFDITTIPFNPDILSGLLWEFDIDGITENNNSLSVFAKAASSITKDKLNYFLSELVEQKLFSDYEVKYSLFEDRNWNEEWEKKTKVIEATERITIKPTFREYENPGNKLIIQLDPKMSFGTGEHATTRLMLLFLEKYIKHNLNILDVGTGTGILAIASALLANTKNIIAIDNDEWCILNSKENIALNELEGKIKIKLAEISQISEKDFDLITANINKNILTQISENLCEKLKFKGTLILSGIYKNDLQEIEEHFSQYGFKILEHQTLNEWAAIVLTKI